MKWIDVYGIIKMAKNLANEKKPCKPCSQNYGRIVPVVTILHIVDVRWVLSQRGNKLRRSDAHMSK